MQKNHKRVAFFRKIGRETARKKEFIVKLYNNYYAMANWFRSIRRGEKAKDYAYKILDKLKKFTKF